MEREREKKLRGRDIRRKRRRFLTSFFSLALTFFFASTTTATTSRAPSCPRSPAPTARARPLPPRERPRPSRRRTRKLFWSLRGQQLLFFFLVSSLTPLSPSPFSFPPQKATPGAENPASAAAASGVEKREAPQLFPFDVEGERNGERGSSAPAALALLKMKKEAEAEDKA